MKDVAKFALTDAPVCPFCEEDGFDMAGLASHIQRHCEIADQCTAVVDASMREFHRKLAECAAKADGSRMVETPKSGSMRSTTAAVAESDLPKSSPEDHHGII